MAVFLFRYTIIWLKAVRYYSFKIFIGKIILELIIKVDKENQ